MKSHLKSRAVSKAAGFTITELLIVMAIIGILTALGVQSYLSVISNCVDRQVGHEGCGPRQEQPAPGKVPQRACTSS
ncbi:type II secretion system protein [Deinococcus sp. Arct2-2]|nr:type II secretion system protein [Deinococcus sp. Arct2-2]